MKLKVLVVGLVTSLLLVVGSFFVGSVNQGLAQVAAPAWITLPPLPESAGDGAAFVLTDTLYYVGGWAGDSAHLFNSVSALTVNPLGIQWTPGSAFDPGRLGAASVVVNGRAYIIGGYAGGSLNRIDSFDGKEWRRENNAIEDVGTELPVVNWSAATTAQQRIYIAGGLPGPTNMIWSSGVNDNGSLTDWRAENPLPLRLMTQMAAAGKCLYVVGGLKWDAGFDNQIYWAELDAVGRTASTWGTTSLPLSGGLSRHAVAIDRDTLYVLGGETSGGELSDKVYAYTINSQTCALTSNPDLETTLPGGGARRLSAVARFGELYVLGGETAKGYTNTVQMVELPVYPELDLRKSDLWVGDFNYGMLITYTLAYTNTWENPDGQSNVYITDTVPANTTFITASSGITPLNGELRWDIDELAPGANGAVLFTVQVDTLDLAWELAGEITITGEITDELISSAIISPSVNYTLAYTPTGGDQTFEGVTISTTLPTQLYPTTVTGTLSAGIEYAYQEDLTRVLVHIPGPLTQPGYITISNCISEAFVSREMPSVPAALSDVLQQTRIAEVVFPSKLYTVPVTCSPHSIWGIKHPQKIAPLISGIVVHNQAWICSDELSGCQSSDEILSRYWPYQLYMPVVARSY